ncbi:H-type lectin domain-containing protein [Paracoccus spongiarum]|uniref:H-type lectin domain-containing protein n=1 Tax=Paracoccus spongiarum TaxID=3064387 RepID=A0ABT9J9G3_9RHOB|nr:H-type lectin domain-containing protein [Paracoccus sp. 2205BS29-5]MDP5306449.1 H-type lectin domain-containing protein [Paracoccus sp. 2205BS29-5]
MQRISQGAVGVTRGASMLFSAFEDEGPMWADEGPRVVRQRITFAEPFLAPPVVHVAIGMWDIAGGSNQRADISSDRISEAGFEIVFRTWGDTRVARIRAEWLAIGAVRHEDDFDL